MEKKKSRIEIIDGLRGLSVVLMVIHHFLYNLVYELGAPEWLFSNPIFDFLQIIFVGVFLFVSGVSSRFSRSNVKRGLIAIALAIVISAVTYLMGMPIWFGILHLLGICMVFFGLTRKLWDLIPTKASPFIFIPLIVASALARSQLALTASSLRGRNLLAILGWPQRDRFLHGFDVTLLPWDEGFVHSSADYQMLLPWLFVFMLGTWAGIHIRDGRLPARFYEQKIPYFPAAGRRALLIYMLHQPVLFSLVLGVRYLFF